MTTQPEGHVPFDTLSHRLMLLRDELGWSQRQAALACGLTFGDWQSMENGRRARGLDIKIQKIAAASGYNINWLMWGGALTPPGNRLPHLDSNQEPLGSSVKVAPFGRTRFLSRDRCLSGVG